LASPSANRLIHLLQYDRDAVQSGEFWRLVTGNLVHWGREQFWLDAGAFLVIGLLFEPKLGRRTLWLILSSSVAVGAGIFLLLPDLQTYRGLSGVDGGLFAARGATNLSCWEDSRWIKSHLGLSVRTMRSPTAGTPHVASDRRRRDA
jgi:rhomboid family GlyGly-CTERM serine protease